MNTINNFYGTVNQYSCDDQKLNLIISKLENMDQALETIKQQLTQANADLDTINTNLDGIGGDVTFLKNKIDQLVNNGQASPAELAELAGLATTLQDKISAAKTKSGDLDASTDSSQAGNP